MLTAALVYLVKGYANSKQAAEQATAANAAVNGEGPEHRLWDKVNRIEHALNGLIAAQEDFAKHGWTNLPSDISDAVALTDKIRTLERNQAANTLKIDTILVEMRAHVMDTKSGSGHD